MPSMVSAPLYATTCTEKHAISDLKYEEVGAASFGCSMSCYLALTAKVPLTGPIFIPSMVSAPLYATTCTDTAGSLEFET